MTAEVVSPIAPGPMEIKITELIGGPARSRGPSPNRGSSLPDFQAIGTEHAKKEDWLQSKGIDSSARVKITKLSHMRYQHPDLLEITRFLKDFGLHVVKKTDNERWYRGYGPDQYVYYAKQGPKAFLGGAFEVESREELEKYAVHSQPTPELILSRVRRIPNTKVLSQGIEEMPYAPGGGAIITVEDPEGFPVSFVHGQSAPEISHTKPEKLLLNDETDKPRQRKFQRFNPGPAEVYKLGHFGMVVEKFSAQMDWYTRYFNIVPSDILYVPMPELANGKPERMEVAMFAHIDRGDDLVDHHTIFLSSAPPGRKHHVHHCSFEVHDFDTQALGHQWLSQKGYKSVWGVGRHILGSQIFDYWWDTTGNMVEHYADGDLVNMQTPMAFGPAGHEGLAVWGPEVPKAFLD